MLYLATVIDHCAENVSESFAMFLIITDVFIEKNQQISFKWQWAWTTDYVFDECNCVAHIFVIILFQPN